jgi:hypothetical protein
MKHESAVLLLEACDHLRGPVRYLHSMTMTNSNSIASKKEREQDGVEPVPALFQKKPSALVE